MSSQKGSDRLVDLLVLEKQNFWLENSHLSASDTQCLWDRRVAELTSALGSTVPILPSDDQVPSLTKNGAASLPMHMSRRLSVGQFVQYWTLRLRSAGTTDITAHGSKADTITTIGTNVEKTIQSFRDRHVPFHVHQRHLASHNYRLAD